MAASKLWQSKSRFVDDELPTASLQLCHNREFYNFIYNHQYDRMSAGQLGTLLLQQVASSGVSILGALTHQRLDLSSHDEVMKSAVKLYASNNPDRNPFYKQFNEATRAALQRTLPLHSYRYSLFFWLMDEFFERRKIWRNGRLFRGVNCEFNFSIKESVFKFNQFTSFFRIKNVAYRFLTKGGTLFVIDGVDQLPISRYSPYPSEDEHIIHPNQAFKIVNIQMDQDVAIAFLKAK